MADKARHAFGMLENVDAAVAAGKIDSYDILFVKNADGKPFVGWIDKDGNTVIVNDDAELTALANQIATKATTEKVTQLETEVATKANAEEVDTKIVEAKVDALTTANAYTDEKLEAAMAEHLARKYEITDVPVGTLVNYREGEIRIMCPTDAVFTKQAVGEGGDANSYYMTFKTYVPNDNVIGYKEHLGDQVDDEILTTFSTDKYGRRYQPTWLALAKYDEATDAWTYYGASSNKDKFIGWDYQIDWFDADGVMVASDCVRINLSNEDCHSSIKPYYGVSTTEEIEVKVEEVVEEKVTTKVEEAVTTSNAYTDAKIAELEEASSYTIVEF